MSSYLRKAITVNFAPNPPRIVKTNESQQKRREDHWQNPCGVEQILLFPFSICRIFTSCFAICFIEKN